MSESGLKLQKAPIVEAVLDIDCDLPPGQLFASLEGPARDCFRDRYPTFRTQLVQEHQIETKPDQPVTLSVRQGLQGFQFLQDDERQLVQVRNQGFSFNRLAPYTSLDDYLPEVERTWRLFAGFAFPVQIRRIQLRYINRILIPMINGQVHLDDFLKVGPRVPEEEKFGLATFLNQYAATELETGNHVNIVLTGQPPENEKLPIIFDNCVVADGPSEPEDWPWIWSRIGELRVLKNRIFKNTLTESCLNLFRQP